MKVDLQGRINKIKLTKKNTIYPLYEAVVNSIQSNSKNIRIEIIREKSTNLLLKDPNFNESESLIKEIIITDDGEGFTTENFNSFETVDTTKKMDIGGKGIGRLTWLKIFEKVEIESTYQEDKDFFKRKFSFDIKNEIMDGTPIKVENPVKIQTIIKLLEIKEKYRSDFPKQLKKISESILYHCLIFFINDNYFRITIFDDKNEICINDLYKEEILENINRCNFHTNQENFELSYLLLPKSKLSSHTISFVANNREVKNGKLSSENKFFQSPFIKENEEYYCHIYIKGNYLDSYVSDDRTTFDFPKEDSLFLDEKTIIAEVIKKISSIYSSELEQLQQKNMSRVHEFLSSCPQYKYLSSYAGEISKNINSSSSYDEIEGLFYNEIKNNKREINTKIKNFEFENDYQEKFETLVKKIDNINNYELSNYVINRRVIISLFEKLLKKKEDGSYFKEEDIHRLIFPMRSTDEDETVSYDSHNLWLVDDRLAYTNYLISDIPLNTTSDLDSRDRVDIASFEKISFSDKELEEQQNNITIIELKRPGRQDIKDVIEQVKKYMQQMKKGKFKTPSGRDITVSSDVKYNVYILCDLTAEIREILEEDDFKEFLDKNGYYKYYEKLNGFVQIFTFNKVLADAKKRNEVFFRKLGIK